MNYQANALKNFTKSTLLAFGCNDQEATVVADHLVEANLAGHDSHGVGMLPMYGLQIHDGNLIPNKTPDLNAPIGATCVVDAQKGFGHHMALQALDHAFETVRQHKTCTLALRNAGHISRVGTYSEYCAAQGYASIHMVNVVGHPPIVAPYGAAEGGFSTNPISMALPVNNKAYPLLDMATSTVAFGKIRVAHNKGEKVPDGYLVDANGQTTNETEPMVERKEGALSAFGEHKGSGLGIFAELMAGALAGTNTIATAEEFPNGVLNNMLSVIIDPSAFDDPDAIAERTTGFTDFIKSKKPASGLNEIHLPGDPENISRTERKTSGVPVDDETIRQILEIAETFGSDKTKLSNLLKT